MRYLAGVLVAASLVSAPAYAQDRLVLEPATDWVLDYDEDSCALKRQFGTEGQQAYLEMRQFGHGRWMQFIIAAADFERRSGPFELLVEPLISEPVTMTGFDMILGSGYKGKLFNYWFPISDDAFLSAQREFAQTATILTEEQRELLLRHFELVEQEDERGLASFTWNSEGLIGARRFDHAFRQTEAYENLLAQTESRIEGILVEQAFDEILFLATGSLHAPMEAMRQCLDELMTHWGIDAEAHKNLWVAVEPVDQARWVRKLQQDYPNRMGLRGMQGVLWVRLDVSVEGKPTACHMQSPINEEDFEREACENLMRHAKFTPALDAQGQPIASYWQTSIVYMIP